MGQRIVTGVPNDRVVAFCKLQVAAGATICEPTPGAGNTSDVLVVFPDAESHDEHAERAAAEK